MRPSGLSEKPLTKKDVSLCDDGLMCAVKALQRKHRTLRARSSSRWRALNENYAKLEQSYEKAQRNYSEFREFLDARTKASKGRVGEARTAPEWRAVDARKIAGTEPAIDALGIMQVLFEVSEIMRMMFEGTEGRGREALEKCEAALAKARLQSMATASKRIN
jgi:hypothetical protein